jgi:PIN domain
MIVLDANILVRAVLGRRVRQLPEKYSSREVRFFAPDVAFNDAEKYLPSLLKRRGKSFAELPATMKYLRTMIDPIDRELYAFFKARRGSDSVDEMKTTGQC